MSYRVLLHPKAADFLKKADARLKKRIKDRLGELESSSKKKGQRLKYSPFRRLRISDYRAICEIDEEKKAVVILFIDHKKDDYDDFSKLL